MRYITAIGIALLLLAFSGDIDGQEERTLTWRNAGPGGGGWIQSIAMDPADANTIHVGSDIGGYYRSIDGGGTFEILNRGLTDYFVERIVVDWSNNETAYLATQSGVFKTVNGGRDWVQKRSGFPPVEPFVHSAPVGALTMDPADPNTLYAGIGRPRWMDGGVGHVYRTTDGAESWDLLDGIAVYADDAIIHQLAMVPDDPRTLWAATDRGLFQSTDAGMSWQRKETGLPHRYCRNVAIHPLFSNRMYVVMWSPPGQTPWSGGVYRSDDSGESWALKSQGLPQHVALEAEPPGTTSNYLALALDPCDADVSYVGADSWWGAGLYRTIDAGEQWELCTRNGQASNMNQGWIDFWGPTIQCLSVSPRHPQTVVFGDAGRVMRTDNGGDSWRHMYTEEQPDGLWRGNGLEVTYLPEITVDAFDPNRLYCGYADIGLMVSENAGHSWMPLSNGLPMRGDVARVVCDPQRQGVAWCCEGRVGLSAGSIAMTADGGSNWEVIDHETSGLAGSAFSLITLDANSPIDARRLYIYSEGNGLFRSEDGGWTWDAADEGLGAARSHVSDLVLDPHDSDRLFAARRWDDETLQGGLYVTENRGATWRQVDGRAELADIQSVAVHPTDPSVIFVGCREYHSRALNSTFAGGVYRTDDKGGTWKHVLEDQLVSCVRISPFDSDLVYASTTRHPYRDNAVGRGVLVSRDGGDTWELTNDGLSNLCVVTLTLDPTNPNRLYAGTGGNGLFVGDWTSSEEPQ